MNIRQFLLLGLMLVSLGCGLGNPAPPGYVEACYGGDYRKNIEGSMRSQAIVVAATEQEWPRLTKDLAAAGEQLGLKFFNTSTTSSWIRTIEVHLCSEEGIWISADQRIYAKKKADAQAFRMDFPSVLISINPYSEKYEAAAMADQLIEILGPSWVVTRMTRAK